jgi:cell wall-associated NlpC family hydrolase
MKQFGVCTLSIVPVRTMPSDKSELSTQLLFGDEYEVLAQSENLKWLNIRIIYDDYEGWIDHKQHTDLPALNAHQTIVLNTLTQLITTENLSFPIVLGSILPATTQTIFTLGTQQFQLDTLPQFANTFFNTSALTTIASQYLHAPYLWGGKTPFGIDCSGLMQQVFKICGLKLPRDAYQQAALGNTIEFGEQKEGDLVFFAGETGKVVHVGLMIDNETIIHAHAYVRLDKLTAQGILNLKTNLYSHRLHSIKRLGP